MHYSEWKYEPDPQLLKGCSCVICLCSSGIGWETGVGERENTLPHHLHCSSFTTLSQYPYKMPMTVSEKQQRDDYLQCRQGEWREIRSYLILELFMPTVPQALLRGYVFLTLPNLSNKLTVPFLNNVLLVNSYWISVEDSLLCVETRKHFLASEMSEFLLAGYTLDCRLCQLHSPSCPTPIPGDICLLSWEMTAFANY